SLVDSVKRLLGGTREVEHGNLDVEIHVKTRDELATLANSFNHMVIGLKEKEHIRETFGKYVDPRVVRGLLENRLPADGGQSQVMSVFFSDLAGFTQICEGLTPDAAVRFLNRYFSCMAEVIQARQGIIDKYIGDSVMAFWGPPFTDPATHALLCCEAALDQMARLEDFRKTLPDLLGVKHGLPIIDIRMGIATGAVTVGNIGSETSRGYTVIGDTVNLASRLEQANKFYGTHILTNEDTARLAGNDLAFREIDSLRVAGKLEPARVFELIGNRQDLNENQLNLIKAFERGLAAYRKHDWDAAEAAFMEGLYAVPSDPPSKVFLERIERFRKSPPPQEWDGVWIATHK
ncbi:MAG: adenylate/guanylate cyclase domain-containing protein, partial [Hydrogenophilaceae bacterium]|nr:adenylate/guanylate cyclase domain-containing protein [Hydrogenophilaceae bacterium]